MIYNNCCCHADARGYELSDTIEITDRVERLEALEENTGISIEGIYVTYTEGENRLRANYDIMARGSLPDHFTVHVSAYNAKGQLIGTDCTFVSGKGFVGLKSCSEKLNCETTPVKVRIYPSAI